MASKDEQTKHSDKELDLSNAGRGVWLVKVPKYLANKLEKAAGEKEVGKLRIIKQAGQKAQVKLILNDSIDKIDPDEQIPKEHFLNVTVVTKQTLGVFSHTTRESTVRIYYSIYTYINEKLYSKCIFAILF